MRHYDAKSPADFLLAFFKFPSEKNGSPKNNRLLWVLPKTLLHSKFHEGEVKFEGLYY